MFVLCVAAQTALGVRLGLVSIWKEEASCLRYIRPWLRLYQRRDASSFVCCFFDIRTALHYI